MEKKMNKLMLAILIIPVILSCETTDSILNKKSISSNDLYIPSELPNVPDNSGNIPAESDDVIYVSNVEELEATVNLTKKGNCTVIIKDGVYILDSSLFLTGNNLTYRSESGMRENVIISGGMSKKGSGGINSIFQISGNNFTLRDMSLGRSKNHGVQILGEYDNAADHCYISNVCFFDIKEQMIKGSWNSSKPGNHADFGIVEYCLFEYTAGQAYQYSCGGIDVHRGQNWRVKGNIFKNIKSPEGRLSEGAVHFWNHSDGTIVKNNKIYNCDRGIIFGMDGSPHYNGIIMNNMIHVTVDAGIYICESVNTKVYNNTVYNESGYPNSIEYRFYCDGTVIANNFTNRAIYARDGADACLQSNLITPDLTYFKNHQSGDLHITGLAEKAINKGISLPEVIEDVDLQSRVNSLYDIGADEVL